MMRLFLTLLFLVPLSAQQPVLVELFTSEGCSSCPPADLLLARLEKEQPVKSANVIVLSLHVDYWDQLGWRDPYSNAQFTRRQNTYAGRLHTQGNYTPQMVVDGLVEFVGSDVRRALASISEIAKLPKTAVRLTARDGGVHIDVDAVPENADVLLALVEPEAVSQVVRGENKGRQMRHVGVVRSLTSAGTVAKGRTFSKDIAVQPHQRIVVFVQAKNQGAVLGSAILGR